jgi:serine/threonine protein kinase/ABC-type branched-subunit amino acid transport system substrate-binding protein
MENTGSIMKCPNCGTNNPVGEDFCSNCGFYLKSAPVPASNSGTFSTGVTASGPTSIAGTGNSRSLVPNTRLQNGRYVVDKILGEGGMGTAVLARDTRVSNKVVVIKELISDNTDPTKHQEDVDNFEREVATLANIDHPLVPTVTDSFQEGSRYFMVQEYAAGEDLEHHMERLKQAMPEREALTYISQVLDILEYLAQQTPPIVHRDIKPANIILGAKDKRARLVDFGIARAEVAKNAKRKQTSALGTPGYAPPEQYQGNADARSDLYALAATLHHLLTNRDPRNYPPFSYPPVRSLNPQISNETERLLNKALQIDVTKRYQTAAQMKGEVDQILADEFGMSGDTSTYVLGNSGQMTAPRRVSQSSPSQPGIAAAVSNTGTRNIPPPPPLSIPPRQPVVPQTQAGMYAQSTAAPRRSNNNNGLVRNFILLILVLALIGTVIFFALPKSSTTTTSTGSPGSTPTAASSGTITVSNSGEGTITVGGQLIGLSAGSYAFDTNQNDGTQKQQASDTLRGGDVGGAISLWTSYLGQTTNDAEALIYLEDQRVISSGASYVTVVVGTMLTGDSGDIQVGRDSLQGAYLVQKDFNANSAQHNNERLRLLIGNSGGTPQAATTVANAIVSAAKQDKSIIGVMGWPYSGLAGNAIPVLAAAHIPMVSQTASSTQLTNISPYFFRVSPSDTSQGQVGATYASNILKAKNVAVFSDSADAYSSSLASGFSQPFQSGGGKVIAVNYTRSNANSIKQAVQTALASNPAPDLIYFAGYSVDVSTVLAAIPDSSKINILGGDALYNLAGYSARTGLNRLHFTAFAYPDEWSVLGYGSQQPAFFNEFGSTYDPANKHSNGTYGFRRPSYNAMLSYDATLTMLTATSNALKSGKTTTGDILQQALSQIKGSNAVQGVSGQISFSNGSDPDQKAVLVIMVSNNGFFQMVPQLGAGKLLVS